MWGRPLVCQHLVIEVQWLVVLTVAVPLAPQGGRKLRAQADQRFSHCLLKMRIAARIAGLAD